MKDGIYHVSFSSNSNIFGEGIAVFKNNTVNGGDHGYVYTGTKTEQGGQFASRLTIKQWDPSVRSVFGSVKEFVLELTGSAAGDESFTSQGRVSGQTNATITIRGRYIAAAA